MKEEGERRRKREVRRRGRWRSRDGEVEKKKRRRKEGKLGGGGKKEISETVWVASYIKRCHTAVMWPTHLLQVHFIHLNELPTVL